MIPFAFFTSCRWRDGTGGGLLMGLLRNLWQGESAFARRFRLALILVDDGDHEFVEAWLRQPLWPRAGQPDALLGAKARDLLVRVPSDVWRPQQAGSGRAERRRDSKDAYEHKIVAALKSRSVEVVVADSYLPIFGRVVLREYEGRILNVHPAITDPKSADRLEGAHPTRDTFTRAAFGWIIVDDKKRTASPVGPHISVTWNGRSREAVRVPRAAVGGVTVHVVTDVVDGGPVVCSERYEIRDEALSIQCIRMRNAKIRDRIVPESLERWADMGGSGSSVPSRFPDKLRSPTCLANGRAHHVNPEPGSVMSPDGNRRGGGRAAGDPRAGSRSR